MTSKSEQPYYEREHKPVPDTNGHLVQQSFILAIYFTIA